MADDEGVCPEEEIVSAICEIVPLMFTTVLRLSTLAMAATIKMSSSSQRAGAETGTLGVQHAIRHQSVLVSEFRE